LAYATATCTQVVTANLSVDAQGAQGTTDLINGRAYFIGGNRLGDVASAVADLLVYATETTAAQTSADFPSGHQCTASFTSSTAGYYSGGVNGGYVTSIDKVTYSSDTTATLGAGANLDASYEGNQALGSPTNGYTHTYYDMNKTLKSADTTSVVTTANLSDDRFMAMACGNQSSGYGYLWGGYLDGNTSTVCDRLTFSSDVTAAHTVADLATASYVGLVVNDSDTNAWILGGSPDNTTTKQMPFATEVTAVNATAALNEIREEGGGASSNSET
jgi:hypothetical protein